MSVPTQVLSRRDRWLGAGFGWLAGAVTRHPKGTIVVWLVVLVVAVPAAASIGSVIANTFGNPLPSSDGSIVAQSQMSALFPNQSSSAPSSTLVLLEFPHADVMTPNGRNATLAVAQGISSDRKLSDVASVTTLYSAYSAYLAGEAQLGLAFVEPAKATLPAAVNETSRGVWGPIGAYVQVWGAVAGSLPTGAPPAQANWPAYQETLGQLEMEAPNQSLPERVLTTFYDGQGPSDPGFNATVSSTCLDGHNITPCADAAARSTLGPALPTLFPGAQNASIVDPVLEDLGVENASSWPAVQQTSTVVLGEETGLDPSWALVLWQAFPGAAAPTPAAVGAWATAIADATPVARYPLPIPSAISGSFVNAGATATIIVVSFSVGDDVTANGTAVTYSDVLEVSNEVGAVLGSSPEYAGMTHYETGAAAIDGATNELATSALGTLLILTVVVLVAIMILYFRAPATPLVSFGTIGVALAVSVGILYGIGKTVMMFNSFVEPVILVFLMAIGTDYTVFLMARYREELVQGTKHLEAVATTVRWAGQSIATSCITVVIVGIALVYSGIGPLSQFGYGVAISAVVALVVALTLIPAILTLVGPKVFWPYTGARFQADARRRREAVAAERGYVGHAARTSTRRPKAAIAIILLLSLPVIYLALQVPVSYDITNIGLPASNPAQAGLTELNDQFGAGYSSPTFVLATFQSPLLAHNQTNAQEFQDVGQMAEAIGGTPGVASVSTLVGPAGAPLSEWLNYSTLLPADRAGLLGLLGQYVGTDGRTVLFNVATNGSGYSGGAVSVLASMSGRVGTFTGSHPEVSQVYYGGAAPTTRDLETLVNTANEGMLVGATIGLFIVLFLILGSAFVPALALAAIGLSIVWGWVSTYAVVGIVEHETLIFLLPLILLIMVLGLGMDYNVLLLTRVREERTRQGGNAVEAVRHAVTHAGGVIAAAAVILGGAFLLLGLTSPLGLISGIGLGIGIAVLLQAFVIQMYLTPAVLTLGKDWIWGHGARARPPPPTPPGNEPPGP
jgi:RND superfamily putative drug exporter